MNYFQILNHFPIHFILHKINNLIIELLIIYIHLLLWAIQIYLLCLELVIQFSLIAILFKVK